MSTVIKCKYSKTVFVCLRINEKCSNNYIVNIERGISGYDKI